MKFKSKNIAEDNIKKIGELFPNCITETKDDEGNLKKAIDYGLLKQILSEDLLEEGDEAYEFTWVGKRESIVEANKPIRKTLRPSIEESKDWDKTENLYIEGDNLDVLKTLQESYLNSVKMIYIDPPYNTGNDFIYNDDFKMTSEEYREESGEIDEDGNRLFKNTDSNGRFHSDWCSMIYSRLALARNLLSDDGVIFISIDDHEVHNLRKICDEVFGESNFIEIFSWQKTSTPPNLSYKTKKSVEYILAYQKQNCGNLEGLKKHSKSTNGLMNQSNKIGILTFPSEYTETSMKNGKLLKGMYGTKSYDIELLNDVEVKNGKFVNDIKLRGKFKWNQDYLDEQIKNGTIIYIKTKALSPSYDKEEYDPEKPWNIIDKSFGVGTNVNASDEVDELFFANFSENLYPKPVSLILYLISMLDMKNEIVLDFFSGSATTAHAVMDLNAKDGGNRKFIMVQLAEETDEKSEAYKAGYKNICEIGKERIRRAGEKIKEENKDKEGIENLDTGFRVLKLDDTNMKDVYYAPEDYEQNLLDRLESNIKEDRDDLDLLFGCLIDWGLPLDRPYESIDIDGVKVHIYNHGDLVACFDKGISETAVKEIAKLYPLRVVFRDGSFTSEANRANIEELFKLLSSDTSIKVM